MAPTSAYANTSAHKQEMDRANDSGAVPAISVPSCAGREHVREIKLQLQADAPPLALHKCATACMPLDAWFIFRKTADGL